ncbi:MocR-like pyridoxine biosynthesis transcription factor PdxR [Williamsia sterculiae]|uniref:MocR-like pyridoxine biosynthesis transcription factor PdxR n=1 Tax=Williamsia sterculiae TaxID=1344003 RepID=UPI000970BBD1|nr:PLP-dependent aminotransferase family protein [Williamsia sterculiae]
MSLDRASSVPLRAQLVHQLKAAIADEVLVADDPLPSTRALAAVLSISRGTAVAAYLELEGEGWIHSTHGAGTFVGKPFGGLAVDASAVRPIMEFDAYRFELVPSAMDPDLVIRENWRSAWRWNTPAAAAIDGAGDNELRRQLAAYLASSRGVPCEAREVVICTSSTEAVTILALALGWIGQAVAMEDPGYRTVRLLLQRIGVHVVPLPVDRPAEVVTRLREMDPPPVGVYLTPAHQFPMGFRYDDTTRAHVVEWAAQTGTVLVEDDYDSEFRYGIPPVAALASIDPRAPVIHLGSAAKILDPGLRVGYMRVPRSLLDEVREIRWGLGSTVNNGAQKALAHYLRTGDLARHVTRVRRIYADRRRVLVDELTRRQWVRAIRGLDAGLFLVAELQPDIDAEELLVEADLAGINVETLDKHRMVPDPTSPALVLGYARHPAMQLRAAVARLSECEVLRPYASP